MSDTEKKRNTNPTVSLLLLGISIGFIYGLIKSIININNNKYLSYELYNLVLFNIQENITTYTIIGLSITILIVIAILVSKKIIRSISGLKLSAQNTFILLIFSSIIIFSILGLSYTYSAEIITFLKSSNLTSWLSVFSNSEEDTNFIFLVVIVLLGIYLIGLIFYFIWQGFLENILRTISDKFNFHIIKSLSLIAIIATLFLNVFIFGYNKLNLPEGPNIILISIDTLRADRLGSYGHTSDTSPNIDKLADEGILFENAFSQAPWTLPSMASMHTSLYPSQVNTLSIDSKIDPAHITLAEYLRNNHYKTIGVISNIIVSKMYGFSQGFEIFDSKYLSDLEDISSKLVTDRAIGYMNENQDEPFFLWVHYYDPHHSFLDHAEYDYGSEYSGPLPKKLDIKVLNQHIPSLNQKDLEYIENIYKEEISYTDKYIGKLIDSVHSLGIKDNTIIILTADHGEEFLERNRFGHGKNLYQELIHVPLIVYVPGEIKFRGKRIPNNVEIRNIPYTIAELIGIENSLFEGFNITAITEEQDTSAVFSEGSYAWGKDNRKQGIIYKNWKLTKNLDDQSYELYDIENDPYEKRNLIESPYPGDNYPVQELKAQLSNLKQEGTQESEKVKFKKEDVDRLKALGYLQ